MCFCLVWFTNPALDWATNTRPFVLGNRHFYLPLSSLLPLILAGLLARLKFLIHVLCCCLHHFTPLCPVLCQLLPIQMAFTHFHVSCNHGRRTLTSLSRLPSLEIIIPRYSNSSTTPSSGPSTHPVQDAVLCRAWEGLSGCSLRVFFNHEAELVGNRRNFRDQLVLQDLEYADNMAIVTDSMATSCLCSAASAFTLHRGSRASSPVIFDWCFRCW